MIDSKGDDGVAALMWVEGVQESVLRTNSSHGGLVDTDLDTLATALYVTTDDLLRAHPERVPARPRIGISPKTSDAEMLRC